MSVTLTVLGLTLLAALPTGASAGEYDVRYCQPGLPLQDWQKRMNAPGTLTESCASGSGGPLAVMAPNDNTAATGVEWILNWPEGIRPVHFRARANRLLDGASGTAEGGISPYGLCWTSAEGNPCPSGVWTSVVVDRALSESDGDPGRTLSIGVRCTGLLINPCGGASGTVDVSQLEVTWRDSAAPTGVAVVDSLTSTPDGGPVRGVQQVEYRTVDSAGSGVVRVEARIDGKVVAASPDQCRLPYTAMQACPTSAIGRLSVDTAKANDGSHQLAIVAIDVGGNEGVLKSATILSQNTDTVGPGSDPGLRGQPNGSYGADDARLSAWWPSTGRGPSKSREVRRSCKKSTRYRRTHRTACAGKPPVASLRANYSARKANIVRGRLLTPGGVGVAGAVLQLVAAPAANGVAPVVVGTLATDGGGRFTAKIPVSAGSASYSVQWRARSRDTHPAATADLRRTVRAATSLAIQPGPVVYRRQKLMFTGKLRGKTGTPAGTAILIQANPGSSWRAVTTVRARASGRWSASYRVPRQLRGRYRFRALVKPSAAYAYAVGATAARVIRVR